MAAKEYGLITRKKPEKPSIVAQFNRLSAFDSDSDTEDQPSSSKKVNISLGETQKRQIKKAQANALSEDPTIFQYDELYEDMQTQKDSQKVKKSDVQKGPKYIKRLLVTAETRKKEYERRIERQVQKERELEGEEFKDKESFVTSSYRAKLEEMKLAEELERRNEYLESIGDVTKQRDLGGFYRHLYEQRMGGPTESSSGVTPAEPSTSISAVEKASPSVEEKSAVNKKERTYRKRKSSENENSADEKEKKVEDDDLEAAAKKAHIQSNLDADSDFSIDSDSDSQSDEASGMKKTDPGVKNKNSTTQEVIAGCLTSEDAVFIKPEPVDVAGSGKVTTSDDIKNDIKVEKVEEVTVGVPKVKVDIWKKRTVGDVLDGAIQRYYERKIARESG